MELTYSLPFHTFFSWIKGKFKIYLMTADMADIAPEIREEMFISIINNYGNMISGICFSFANDKNDVADLRQDILLNIWRGLPTFRETSSISTWLYRVALNTCVSTVRKKSKRIPTIALEGIMEYGAESDFEQMERIEWLNYKIEKLQPLDKAILTMWLDEQPYEEIAKVTGISRNNVAVRLNRIKQKMAND